MKIAAIKKLCIEAHMCMIYNTEGDRQWIGTDEAIYPADGLGLNKQNITVIFDMPDAEEKMEIGAGAIQMCELMPRENETEITLATWEELHAGIPMEYMGDAVFPLMHRNGIMFVRKDYVKPAIRKNDYLAFKLARNGFEHPLIVIGNGLDVSGIVRPVPEKEARGLMETLQRYLQFVPEGSPDEVDAHSVIPKERDEQIRMEGENAGCEC